MTSQIVNNEEPQSAVHIRCAAKGTVENGVAKLSFQGYSGDSVDLSDYGFDYPVVYDIKSMVTKQKQPIMYNHNEAVGHTTNVRKVDNNSAVRGKGLASLPGPSTDRIVKGLQNGFPFEASLGLKGLIKNIDFISQGKVTVNNREFTAPVYVWYNTEQKETTITEFGRDSNTSFEVLNEEKRMKIKNAKPKQTPPVTPKIDNSDTETTPPENTPEVEATGTETETETETEETETETNNSVPRTPHVSNGFDPNIIRAMTLANKYPDHQNDVIAGLQNGWDDQRIEDSIQLKVMNAMLPRPPKGKTQNPSDVLSVNNELFARTCLAFGASPEKLAKKLDNKIVDQAHDKTPISITEVLLNVANAQGGRFTGHSDVEEMCKFIRNTGYSTFDLPDFFKKVGETLKEERWELNAPFAPQVCKEGSNKDFRKTERKRITGGEMWKEVAKGGKLDLFSTGGQKKYETELQTYGTLFTMTREEVINDDQGALNDMMDAMVEGAMVIPDYQLGRLMLTQAAAADTFWVNNDNSFTGSALTRANLSTRYKAIRKYTETKNDGIDWTVMMNERWTLIVAPDLEEEAWDIVKQDRIVNDTTANTKTGDKNYWFGRLDIKVFGQMGNTSAFGTGNFATQGTWILWPSSLRFAPYEITYLRGRKSPIIESVPLEASLLGFGTRGYWDVKVNERERTAIMRNKA